MTGNALRVGDTQARIDVRYPLRLDQVNFAEKTIVKYHLHGSGAFGWVIQQPLRRPDALTHRREASALATGSDILPLAVSEVEEQPCRLQWKAY